MTLGSLTFGLARPIAIAAVLTCAFEAQAGIFCINLHELTEPSDAESRQRIESYMKSRYSLATIQIRYIENRFFVVLPQNDNCKPCYYHIIRVGDSNITEHIVFEGTGVIATWDSPWFEYLGDVYTFYYLLQANQSYLFIGFPRSGGAPLVSAPSSEAAKHAPRCPH